jgi:hypothetical protein
LQQYRTEFAQKGEKDVIYLERIWSNGADTVELSAAEMRQLAGMIENPHIHEGLLMALKACPEATRTLFAWITEAWRNTVPDMDLSSVEAEAVQWRNFFFHFSFIIHMCIQGLVHFSPLPPPPPLPPTPCMHI